ncbi:hepatocyte growth factor-like [Haliotis rufescens]|uniref:hepatocyte growth factor-like n=1 Tax=Haliotis rufescens TaxID=6454 RepID=UPI00201F1B54|nr:hepatocyte growth factor-like [Haliotis rufescens]
MKTSLITMLFVELMTGGSQDTGTCSREVNNPGLMASSRLVGSVYLVLQTLNLQDCVASCLQQSRCDSLNFKAGQCELNYDNSTTAPSGMVAASGWNHASASHMPSRLVGICGPRPCDVDETCRDRGGSYECEPEELCYIRSTLYPGTLNITKTGRTCQSWDTDTPHKRWDYPMGMSRGDPALVDESNYCRVSPATAVPWCYTLDPSVRWEKCSVPFC